MHWRYHEAVINALRKIWTGHPRTSSELLAMTRDYRTLTVDTDDELVEAVLASLERLQDRIHVAESPELRALWNEPRTGGTPSHKSEEVLSDTIADWLRRDLGRGSGIILNREVRATRLGRLDIKVEAAPRNRNVNLLTVAIEIKGDWNRKIATSLGTQLVGNYLQTNGWTHGIYLIGWFQHNDQRRKLPGWSPTDINDARQIVLRWQADQTPVGLTVQPVVLDCSLSPASSAVGDRSFELRGLESKTLCTESKTKSSPQPGRAME